MKKMLSLFLALVMALSLCVTAFAGNAAGTSVIRLTGDAADQVVDLKSGQRLSADSSTLVRLNVLNDPSAEEYTVTLDGETLKADHSTAQYHVYSLPADKLTARTATLSVNSGVSTQAAEGVSVTVKVGTTEKKVALPADGSTDASTPTTVTADFENPGSDAAMDRIYFDKPEGVTLGTGLSKGVISGELTKLDAGYTSEQMFFYKDPKAQTKSVKAIWNDGTEDHYYTITVKRAAQEGYVLAPGSSSNESNPAGANTYNAATGCVTAMVKGYAAAPFTFHDLTLFNAGKTSGTTVSPAFPTDEAGLYYLKDGTTVYFARPGRYWIPASVEKDGVTYEGEAPFMATWTLTALNAQLDKAKDVQASVEFKALPDSVQAQFNTIVDHLTAGSSNMSGNVMVNAAGKITTGGDATDIQARDIGGKQIFTERLLEGDECALMDLMAIFQTYKTNKTLGQYQAQAYQKIAALGLSCFTEVTTAAQKTSYTAYKQAKWDLLKTTDLDGINAILTSLKLETITPAEPEVTVGDINGDGDITLKDATLLLQHVNKVAALNDSQLTAADINGDGSITLKDATLLLQYVNKLIDTLPSGSAE